MDEREVQVPHEDDQGDPRQGHVHGARAVEEEAVVALPEPQEEARDEKEDREGDREDRVQLLAGIELPLRCVTSDEPAPVVDVEVLDLAPVLAQGAAVTEGEDE